MTSPTSRRDRWARELEQVELGYPKSIKFLFELILDWLDGHDKDITDLTAEVKRLRISINAFTGVIALSAITICVTIVLAVTK